MKDVNDILSQFDDLQTLPVSEELLGAYIEGNLDPLEELEVQQACASSPLTDDVLAHSMSDTTGGQSDFIDDVELSVLEDMDFELPEIPEADGGNTGYAHDFLINEPFAASDDSISTSVEEAFGNLSPLQDYDDAGANGLDDPFADDFFSLSDRNEI